MTRSLAAAAALATLVLASLAFAGTASAQTWGQPVYLNPYGRPVGGTPLSEVETRSYVATGRWADGYSDRPQVYVPAPGHGADYRHDRSYDRYGYGRGRGYGSGNRRGYGSQDRRGARSQAGYRDEWGYQDDRPPSAQRRSDAGRSRWHDGDCGCAEVYMYDR